MISNGNELRKRRTTASTKKVDKENGNMHFCATGSITKGESDTLFNKVEAVQDESKNEVNYSIGQSYESLGFHYWVFRLLYMNGYLFHAADDWDNPKAVVVTMGCILIFLHFPKFEDWVFSAFLYVQMKSYYKIMPSLANHSNLHLVMNLVLIPNHVERCYNSAVNLLQAIVRKEKKDMIKFHNDRIRIRSNSYESTGNEVTEDCLCTLRWTVVILYFFAGFHKINSDFFDLEVTCAFKMIDRMLAPLGMEAHEDFPLWLQLFLPPLVIAMELVPALLFAVPKYQKNGILMLLMIHGPLAFVGFADFSSIGMANLILFVAPSLVVAMVGRNFIVGISLMFVLAHMHFGIDKLLEESDNSNIGAYEGLILVAAFTALWVPYFRSNIPGPSLSLPKSWWNRLVPAFFIFFCMNNYLGLRTAGTVSMFSNLRTEGPTSNHLLLGSNPIKVFGYQDDRVHIVDVDPRVRKQFRRQLNPDVVVPWIQFCSLVLEIVWYQYEDFYIRVSHQGMEYESSEVAIDTNFTSHFSCPWWQTFFLEFREIYVEDGKQVCMW